MTTTVCADDSVVLQEGMLWRLGPTGSHCTYPDQCHLALLYCPKAFPPTARVDKSCNKLYNIHTVRQSRTHSEDMQSPSPQQAEDPDSLAFDRLKTLECAAY
uniref:Uncharacterized protein n=1 Tax=Eutreptiella gymnastica TaxID=73025 RepID=A0A7S1NB73_9EUGL|mmetsp:Transcript_150591/g.263180  ORF Transcript_150591/g.263180 Transcript_150591/m.263180 type:complete len:102 (+) Transcript_150591:1527-1832(+)